MFNLFVLLSFVVKRCTRLFFKQPWLLSVEAQKWSKVKEQLSNAKAQIVSRFKQLRLKPTAQKGALLVEEY